MLKTAAAILVSAAFMFSAPAFAVDGVVLINQSTVLAAGGFPYKITQPGSYKLSGNLVVSAASTDGIDINVSNVTVDLNGFTISGPVTCSSAPPSCEGTAGAGITIGAVAEKNLTVRNGSVVGFQTGVDLCCINELIEEIHASGNSGNGIQIGSGVLRRSTSSVNGGSGIYATYSTVMENVSSYNALYGLAGDQVAYGGNSFNFNVALTSVASPVSQGNNSCDGTAC
jgi:hypothetical protein